MRYLIINGDDLGLSPGVNRGIVEANSHGVLTSASLIVNSPWTADAVERIGDVPSMSIGLHVNLADENDVEKELRVQARLFQELVGRPPTHIDSHHDHHQRADVLPHFVALAAEYGVPLRGHSSIRSLTSFYGQWDGASHPEQIGVDGLVLLLRAVEDGITELACHPGHADAELHSSYSTEREIELATLCHPRIPAALRELGIDLIGSSEVTRLSASR